MTHTYVLRSKYALGDTVLVTALARDVHRAYPGKFRLMADGHWSRVWDHNPNVEQLDYSGDRRHRTVVDLTYTAGITASRGGEDCHFLSWWHRDFERQTGLAVPVTEPKGDIHLSAAEARPVVSGRYWVVVAGGKLDMTVKHWEGYQAVVDMLRPYGVRFVQAGAAHRNHVHPPLRGVLQGVGHTDDVRDFFSLVAHADGVLCGITGAMHVAACFDKPCVVVAGGRERPAWEAYTNAYFPASFGPHCRPVKVAHRFLHATGLLPCAEAGGCWRAHTVPLEQRHHGPGYRRRLCTDPVRVGTAATPRCMQMITPDHAAEAVMSYYEAGVIPPVTDPSRRYALPPAAPVVTAEPVFARPPVADRPPPQPPPAAVSKPVSSRSTSLDHPIVGGKFTCFVLCWGPHPELARRCVGGILDTAPPGSVDLRVACNECCPETVAYLRSLPLGRLYVYAENRRKYPVMRDLFRDEQAPINTPYLLWFDDDSYPAVGDWVRRLSDCIVANHPHGGRMYGWKHIHDFGKYFEGGARPDMWFRSAPWYRGKNFRTRASDRPTPNGTVVEFATGGFWALHTDTMRECDIPDSRLVHNGGDCTIGEQIRQAGHKLVNFNQNKQVIVSSGAPRRGVSDQFPWATYRG